MQKFFKVIGGLVCFLTMCTFFFSYEFIKAIQPEPKAGASLPETIKYKKADIVISPISGWSYLCAGKADPVAEGDGCVDVCVAKGLNSTVMINCHMLEYRPSRKKFEKVDVVVNHHLKNVPNRTRKGPPYLTVFYKGESNANDGLNSLKNYPMYDRVISFQRYHTFYFTYAHSYRNDFLNILALNNNSTGPTKDSMWLNWKKRLSAVAVFVSNCDPLRKRVIKMLSMVYEVHSFGRCHNNCSVPAKCSHPHVLKQKMCVLRNYKYTLTMENTKEPEYVTEKVYDVLLSGSVPLYWGAPNAAEFVPNGRKSFIEIDEYLPVNLRKGMSKLEHKTALSALKKMSDRLRKMETEKETITQLLQWRFARRGEEWGEDFWNVLNHRDSICSICLEAYKRRIGTRI